MGALSNFQLCFTWKQYYGKHFQVDSINSVENKYWLEESAILKSEARVCLDDPNQQRN